MGFKTGDRGNPRIDITGKKFGFLTVIKPVYRNGNRLEWECLCDCGNTNIVRSYRLLKGTLLSCGCRKAIIACKTGKPIMQGDEANFRVLLHQYKCQAKNRGYSFELTDDEFREITSSNCYYCGIEPKQIENARRDKESYMYNGVDRVNNKLGYSSDNCVPCCGPCNYMKRDFSANDFINHCKIIANKFGGC